LAGKIVANRTVDFEQVQWLNFTIRAQDHGSPPRIAELPVFMRIVDVNDNNPVFTQPSYQVARRQGGGGQLADPVGPLSGAACCLMTAAVYLARRSLSRALQLCHITPPARWQSFRECGYVPRKCWP
jgi:hypothetical protein